MSEATKTEIIRAYNAGSAQAQIMRALGGRYSRAAISGVIFRAREAGLITRAEGGEAGSAAASPPPPRDQNPIKKPAPAAAAPLPKGVTRVEATATLRVELDAETWGWLRDAAADAASRGDRRGPAAMAAAILREVAREETAEAEREEAEG